MYRSVGLLVCLVVIVVQAKDAKETKVKATIPAESIIKLTEHMIPCVDESGVAPDIMFQIREKKPIADENFQKFMYCMFRRLNLGDKKGHLKVDKVADFLRTTENEDLKRVIVDCNTKQGKNSLETASNVFLCTQDRFDITYAM